MLIANLLVTVVAVGMHAAVMKLTGADDVLQLTQVICRTAPLALAVAGIVCVTLWQLERDAFNFGVVLLASAAALFVASWMANQFGDLRVIEPVRVTQQSHWGLQAAAEYGLGMLLAYYRAYGARDFWSSVIVGTALGWIWSRAIERASGQVRDAADAAESNRSDRLAA